MKSDDFGEWRQALQAYPLCRSATHSRMLMAYPDARLLRLSKYGLDPVTVDETEHFRIMREFWAGLGGFIRTMLEE